MEDKTHEGDHELSWTKSEQYINKLKKHSKKIDTLTVKCYDVIGKIESNKQL